MANHEPRKVTVLRSKTSGPIVLMPKQGRNEICRHCGSGEKVKKCTCQWARYCIS
jgi:hypothetical protein